MPSGDTSARSENLAAWVANTRRIHPTVEKAKHDGCLSQGTLEQLASPRGIPLACTTAPVVLIVPCLPVRNVKYHVPEQPPRLTEDVLGNVRFEAGEHAAIGDSAVLRFSASDKGTLAHEIKLTLPNGLKLTYGEIVALGGDFYGIPDAPISDGQTQAERVDRFINAYSTLATATPAASEAPQILAVMQTEIDVVNEYLKAGKLASSAYAALGDTLSEKWNRITGGGSWISPWYPLGRYLQLSNTNWDHFGEHAILAYQAGHATALREAKSARDASPASAQRQVLEWAYAKDAFANHFLSDVFSGGHIRSPRKQLNDNVFPSELGGLLTRAMHDEDSHWGLAVHNAAKDGWRAYGDKRYFDTVDLANKAIVDRAVQESVTEVFDAFHTGTVPPPENYRALRLVADLVKAKDPSGARAAGNISPLFVWNGSVLLRRNDVNNLNDYSWNTDWWGWSTLLLLQSSDYSPPPPQGYLQPPTTSPKASANGGQSGAQVCYAASFVDKLYESDPGPWGNFVTVRALQSVSLTDVPTGPPGTTSRRIYRFANQPCTYAGEIRDNTTTTFVDNAPLK